MASHRQSPGGGRQGCSSTFPALLPLSLFLISTIKGRHRFPAAFLSSSCSFCQRSLSTSGPSHGHSQLLYFLSLSFLSDSTLVIHHHFPYSG